MDQKQIIIQGREELITHIEGLQFALTQRNKKIEELEQRLSNPVDIDEETQKLIDEAFKKGYKQAAFDMTQSITDIVDILAKVNGKARNLYYRAWVEER